MEINLIHSLLADCKEGEFIEICRNVLNEEEFSIIGGSMVMLRFKRGETILKQGAHSTQLAFLTAGIVKHVFDNGSERDQILAISASPNLIGGANMFSKGTNAFSIVAVEDCKACMIEIDALRQVMLHNSRFALMLFEMASEMFHDAIFNFINLAHKHVNGRVADIFLFLSRSIYKSTTFTLTLTRKEIAEFAGVSQENVITTLSRFRQEGIILTEGKKVVINDFDRMVQISKLG